VDAVAVATPAASPAIRRAPEASTARRLDVFIAQSFDEYGPREGNLIK
jgi:hypothetical protein